MKRATRNRLFGAVVVVVAAAMAGMAQQITGVPGSPDATTTIDGKQLPAARPEVRRRDQGQRRAVEGLVAAARGAAQGRAQRAA